MKTRYLIYCFITTIGWTQQYTKNTIGLRLGASDGFGTELSYQRALTDINRFEFNLGWRSADSYDGLRLNAIYQWIWPLDYGFNWYYGGGVGFSNFNSDSKGNEFIPGILGSLGLEYNFNFPVLVSLDLRPGVNFSSSVNAVNFDLGLGVRYQFD